MINFDEQAVNNKNVKLQEVAAALKLEFFGLDEVIDRVIDSIRAWYILPEIVNRPVIVNLWGLTGTGKTQLVRRLSYLLGFKDRFVEIQMDGVTSSGSYKSSSISSCLDDSCIEEGKTGIVLLDEFQRFRTVSADGSDVKTERFNDVWMLLSDGKFAADSSLKSELDMYLLNTQIGEESISEDQDDEEEPARSKLSKHGYTMYPYVAGRLKKMLKLPESIPEIMRWPQSKIVPAVMDAIANVAGRQVDYSKLLIFVSGNLDEAYSSARSVDDCDTDADRFYQYSKSITITTIKSSLLKRFKPEQISRLGNNHVIYPSLDKKAYQQLIRSACASYIQPIAEATGIEFTIEDSVFKVIYENAVYPSQGTRPVFSSVHTIFSGALVQIAYWAIINKYTALTLSLDSDKRLLIGSSVDFKTCEQPVILDVASIKAGMSQELLTRIAVHEAGHAIVYAVLYNKAPVEVQINLAAYKGGFVSPVQEEFSTFSNQLKHVTVALAGFVAEMVVYSAMMSTTASSSDFAEAVKTLQKLYRNNALQGKIRYEVQPSLGEAREYSAPSIDIDAQVQEQIRTSQIQAEQIIRKHLALLVKLVDYLVIHKRMDAAVFDGLAKGHIAYEQTECSSYRRFKEAVEIITK